MGWLWRRTRIRRSEDCHIELIEQFGPLDQVSAGRPERYAIVFFQPGELDDDMTKRNSNLAV